MKLLCLQRIDNDRAMAHVSSRTNFQFPHGLHVDEVVTLGAHGSNVVVERGKVE